MPRSAETVDSAGLELRSSPSGTLAVVVSGRLDATTLPAIWGRASQAVGRARAAAVEIDASGVTYCDSVGAALCVHLRDLQEQRGGTIRLAGFPEAYQPIIDLLLKPHAQRRDCPERVGQVERIGRATVGLARDSMELIVWVGRLVLALIEALIRPSTVRWRDMLRAAQITGVDSFPVVVLVAALIGLVLGFQSAIQLQQFGGDIFLANLIGLSMVRELGPLMTAVVLTARSGSAFAAEIGTMQIAEEVDALRTMGIDPVRFLVTPRMIAALFVTPILTVFANIAGVAGGGVVWVTTLGMSLPGYGSQLEQAIGMSDILGGLFKSFVFGLLIAAVGCVRGMQTRGGPSAVGHSTTSAVVSGIVLIALTDSAFSVIYFHLGI